VNGYIVSCDNICILVHHRNSSTELQFEGKILEQEFMTKVVSILRIEIASSSEENVLTRNAHNKGFRRSLMDSVDESLSTLGCSAKRAIYFHLERSYRVKKTEIPERIEDFANAIEDIFGDGAKLIEIQIMRKLYEKTGYDFLNYPHSDDLSFVEYLQAQDNSMSDQ
jgi:hypothetical protein